jgi:hypothetical protein
MEGYISVHDAARRLNRSTEQVRRYLREGKLAGRRIGGQWFVEAAGLGERAMVREPAALYETRPTATGDREMKKARLISDELARAIEQTREEIRAECGELDVVALIRADREAH